MVKHIFLALLTVGALAACASSTQADSCYRGGYGYRGEYPRPRAAYYGGYGYSRYGYAHPRNAYYAPSVRYRQAYPSSPHARHGHHRAPNRGGIYFSIGF